jgi:hypothetical protein
MLKRVTGEQYRLLLSTGLICGGVVCLLVAVIFCVRFYNPIPYADSWNIIDELVMNGGHGSLELLWRQHSEHRMALTKLFIWMDLFYLGGKDISLFTEIFLTQALEAFFIAFAVRRLAGWSWREIYPILGVALYCAFSPVQYEVFEWSIGLQTVSAYALISISYIAFAIFSLDQKRPWLLTAILCAIVAPFTLASGLIVWPGLLLLSWNLRFQKRTLAMIGFLGSISITSYLAGYVRPVHHSDVSASIMRPAEVIRYVLIYFGSSWDGFGRTLGMILASVALSVVIGWTIKVMIYRNESPLRVAILGIASSLIASSFGTALGRLNFGLEQAASSRYQTCSMLFWSCLFILCIDLVLQFKPQLTWCPSAAALAVMLLSIPNIKASWEESRMTSDGIHAAMPALVAEVKDDSALTGLVSEPFLTFRDLDFMRAEGMSVYNTFEYRRMGSALKALYQIAGEDRCAGSFDRIEAINDPDWPGFRGSGWAWDNVLSHPIEKVILTDGHGRIIGLGLGGEPRPDVKQSVSKVASTFTGWKGYVNGAYSWTSALAYGELPDGHSVCVLPGTSVDHPKPLLSK